MTVRITCLECIKDDFTDNMDVCEACADKSCDRDGLDHKPSHAVLRCSTYLFANRYVRMVEKGKESWKQYKASFARVKAEVLSKPAKMASQDDALGHRAVAAMNLNASKAKSEAVLPQCTYCEKVIAPPFWGCIECRMSIFSLFSYCEQCSSILIISVRGAHLQYVHKTTSGFHATAGLHPRLDSLACSRMGT